MALLAAMPVMAIADGALGQELIALAAAIMLLLAAAAAPQSEITNTFRLLKRISVAILLPAAWMLLQIAPIPFASLVNPIWPTASAALNEPSLLGHLSLDPASTLRCLMLYLTIVALVVATIIITQDRQNAETTLFVLCTVTAVMSVELLLSRHGSLVGNVEAAATCVAASIAGTLLNAAAITLLIERHLSRRDREASPFGPLLPGFGLCVAAATLCAAANLSVAPGDAVVATGFGLMFILIIALVRRFAVQSWSLGVLLAIVGSLALGIAVVRFQRNTSATILAFSSSGPPESLAIAVRAIPDFKWFGSGVGTYSAVAEIYRDYGTAPVPDPPSTMAAIALEWGQPALAIVAGIAVQLFVFVFRGALRRGRDYFFSAVAAATLVGVFYEALSDASLTHFPVQVIIAVIMGLGISQSIGRTSGP